MKQQGFYDQYLADAEQPWSPTELQELFGVVGELVQECSVICYKTMDGATFSFKQSNLIQSLLKLKEDLKISQYERAAILLRDNLAATEEELAVMKARQYE